MHLIHGRPSKFWCVQCNNAAAHWSAEAHKRHAIKVPQRCTRDMLPKNMPPNNFATITTNTNSGKGSPWQSSWNNQNLTRYKELNCIATHNLTKYEEIFVCSTWNLLYVGTGLLVGRIESNKEIKQLSAWIWDIPCHPKNPTLGIKCF